MKEPFVVSTSDLIAQTQIISDMELQSYLGSLGPSQSASLVQSNINAALQQVENSKKSIFQDTLDQTTGADNNITSAAFYLSRTKDLVDAAGDMNSVTRSQLSASMINAGLSQRQTEINEWSNFNKLDTLYFLQILFISLSLIGVLSFLLSNGSITQSLFTFVAYIIAILATVVILLRWRYSNVARDSRYWHKSRFPNEARTPLRTAKKCRTGWLW